MNRLAISRPNRRQRECDALGVPLKQLKPAKGGPKGPGKAFWLVLIVIGGMTVWQKVGGPEHSQTADKQIHRDHGTEKVEN